MTRIATALAVSAIAASAFAGSAPVMSNNASHAGVYAGVLGGYNYSKYTGSINGTHISNRRGSSYALGLNAGYQFNQNIAVELGYLHFGHTTVGQVNSVKVRSKAAAAAYVAAKGIYPINSAIDVFGKLGVAGVQDKYIKTATPTTKQGTEAALLAGVGGEYYFTQNVSASVEADYLSQNGRKIPQHFLALAGLAYHF